MTNMSHTEVPEMLLEHWPQHAESRTPPIAVSWSCFTREQANAKVAVVGVCSLFEVSHTLG